MLETPDRAAGHSPETASPNTPTRAPLRVLHVEDSEIDHLMMQAQVRQAGLQVQWTRVETLEAFAEALADDWDAVVCDYQLPGHSGLDMLRHLRATERVLPFVLVSGEIGEDVAVAAMREGASDYLLKNRLARLGPALEQAIKAAEAERSRRAAAEALRESSQRLQELTAHLQQRIEAERAALARELHDDVGSALTALKYELGWMQRHAEQAVLRERVGRATETLDAAIEASRRLMENLRPPILQEGLVAALQWLVQGFERRQNLPVLCIGMQEELDLPEPLALVAYRFVQEALHNIAKHAQASQVRVELQRASGVLGVEVHDDGRGMDAADADKSGHFGLRGLRERAASVGGWVDLSTRLGRGVQLVLSIPLDGEWDPERQADAAWLGESA
jgi:signal transduction histidine kinase